MVRVEDVARSVAGAALAVPGVACLSPGEGVETSTQFSGGKIIGVRLSGSTVVVRVVADRVPLEPVAADVRAAVRAVLSATGDDRPVTVFVDDVAVQALIRRGA
jgi:hypothetical protein